MTANTARRILVEQVKARVFCSPNGVGGNPVTIFSTDQALSPNIQKRLAQSCDWESVILHRLSSSAGASSTLPEFSFYMPSGEQVSFCAHAAMGAAFEMARYQKNNEFGCRDIFDISFIAADLPDVAADQSNEKLGLYQTSINFIHGIAKLQMKTPYEQQIVSKPSILSENLSLHCNIEGGDLLIDSSGQSTCCHASVARPKTLIPLNSANLVNEKAVAPKLSKEFAGACKNLDDTTGLYLYAPSKEEDGMWECRQFPRASGYPEDPATGIAAAALVCHLASQHNIILPSYKIQQGTAMGKPSVITLENLEINEKKDADQSGCFIMNASFCLLGKVQIDKRDIVEIDYDVT